jgi:hypothetical protein
MEIKESYTSCRRKERTSGPRGAASGPIDPVTNIGKAAAIKKKNQLPFL